MHLTDEITFLSESLTWAQFHTNRNRVIEVPPASTSWFQDKDFVSDDLCLDKGLIVGIFAWRVSMGILEDPIEANFFGQNTWEGIQNLGIAVDGALS